MAPQQPSVGSQFSGIHHRQIQRKLTPGTGECKRPGCGNAVPPGIGRGRHRVFCGDDCARRYHNDARVPVAADAGGNGNGDPFAALETLLRQAAALARTARDHAGLDPARVRAEIADAEAACRDVGLRAKGAYEVAYVADAAG